MKRNEQLLNAMSDIGDDLILESERPMRNPWRTALSLAACAAILVGMGTALGQYLRTPVQTDPALPPAAEQMETPAPMEQTPVLTQPPVQTPAQPVLPEEDPIQPETPEAPQEPIPLPESQPVYVFQTDSRAVAVDEEGTVVLEVPGATMELVEDQRTGEPAALLVMENGDYRLDGWGNTYDERATADLYDLNGQLITQLPGRLVGIDGMYVLCTNLVDTLPKVYDRFTGKLLYENVKFLERLETNSLISTEDRMLLLNPSNEIVAELPEDCKFPGNSTYVIAEKDGREMVYDENGNVLLECPYEYVGQVIDADCGRYFLVAENRLEGVVDANGELVFDLVYQELRQVSDHLLQGKTEDGDSCLLDLSTGKLCFQWPGNLTLADDRLIAQLPDWKHTILDFSGNQIVDESYDMIQVLAKTKAGKPGLFLGKDWGNDQLCTITCFVPNGTILWKRYSNYDWQLEQDVLLFSQENEITLLDPWTGTVLYEEEGDDLRAEPLDYEEIGPVIRDDNFIVVTRTDEHGAEEASVVHISGRTVLEGCRELVYRGGGVVQCTQNGISGLLRLDGTWLYQAPMK